MQPLPSADKIVHAGRLYRYKKGRLSSGHWKECWMVVYSDGTLVWYSDKHCTHIVKESPTNLNWSPDCVRLVAAVGNEHLKPPEVLPFADLSWYFVVQTDRMSWFCTKSAGDLVDWVGAFARTVGRDRVFQIVLEKLLAEAHAGGSGHSLESIPEEEQDPLTLLSHEPEDCSALWQALDPPIEEQNQQKVEDLESGFGSQDGEPWTVIEDPNKITVSVDVHAAQDD